MKERGEYERVYLPKNETAYRTLLREVKLVDNTTIEAFSGLSCFGIPTLRDTNPQVFTGLGGYLTSNESMEKAYATFSYHPVHFRR